MNPWKRLQEWRDSKGDFLPCRTPWWEDELDDCSTGVPVGVRNTYSNIAYGLVGLSLYFAYGTPEAAVMAWGLVVLMLGSAAYHAVPGRFTNRLDHLGMYAVFLALVTAAAGGEWLPMLVAATAGGWVLERYIRANLNAMMGFVLWIAGVAAWHEGSYPLLFGSSACFVAAMVFWLLDKRREYIGRWGHAAWHIGTAVAIGLMYKAVA